MTDHVYNPPHYKQGKVECIEAIQSALTEEEFRVYCEGSDKRPRDVVLNAPLQMTDDGK